MSDGTRWNTAINSRFKGCPLLHQEFVSYYNSTYHYYYLDEGFIGIDDGSTAWVVQVNPSKAAYTQRFADMIKKYLNGETTHKIERFRMPIERFKLPEEFFSSKRRRRAE